MYHSLDGQDIVAQTTGDPVSFRTDRLQLLEPIYSLDTKLLPKKEQYAAWRERTGPLVELQLLRDSPPGFVAQQTAWDLCGLMLTHTTVPAVSFSRRSRQQRADGIDHWFFSVLRRGEARTVGSGRASHETAGSLRIQSLQSEFEGTATAFEGVHLFVPRDFARGMAAALDAADNTQISSGLGQLLADYLLDLELRLPMMTADELPGLSATLQAMILACVVPSPDAALEARGAIHMTILERARRIIQRDLFSPTLGANQLCRELGVSRSGLYRMFEPLGGVVHYIRRRRLLDAHAALSNADDPRTIVEIAAERGFMDAADFSRSFKREFGYRPSDARSHASAWPSVGNVSIEASERQVTLSDLLLRLR